MGIFKKLWLIAFTIYAGYTIFLFSEAPILSNGDEKEVRYRILGPLADDDERLTAYVKSQYLQPPSSKPYNLTIERNELNYVRFYKGDTWPYIHFYLEKFFSDEGPGFFMEAGALDGEFLSNTLWLEQKLRWRGLLVEPDKDNYHDLLSKNRRSWTSNTCLSTKPYPKVTTYVSKRLRKDLSKKGIPWNQRGTSHELGVNIAIKTPSVSVMAENSYSVIQCLPIITFLRALNVSTVDFLSLDIQGGEKDVLRSIPWDSIKIRVIVAEIFEEHVDHNFERYMENSGYVFVNRERDPHVHDHLYVRNDEISLLKKIGGKIIN